MIKIKTVKIKLYFLVLVLAIILSVAFSITAYAAEEVEIKAPAGSGSYSFSIDLIVNEVDPYCGIEFGLTLSDENALEFESFTKGSAVKSATDSPFTAFGGTHYFGFWTDANAFRGELKVGTMNFTYTGSSPQTITITNVLVARIEDNAPVGTNKESPVRVIKVSREASTPSDNTGGGGGSGTENQAQIVIDDSSTPLTEAVVKSKYFDDVDENWSWAAGEIDFLYEAGVVKGTADRIYSPAKYITRGDFMLMLIRSFDLKADINGNFPDVPIGSYYYDAIGIAKALGIAKGDGVNFNPRAYITRQDMMTLIDRTLRTVGRPLPAAPQTVLSGFPDYTMISDYAREPVAALVQSGIIKGDGEGIKPRSFTTRAQMAVVIYRILTMEQTEPTGDQS